MTTPNGGSVPGGRGPGEMFELATVTPPAQANPDLWDAAENARSFFSLNILSGFASIGAAISQALNDIANSLFGGLVVSDHPALDKIRDGQLDLIARLDDVSGYAVAYMTYNRYKDRKKWNRMEFDGAIINNPKNASYVDDGIQLAEGTWFIDAQITHDHHVNRRTSRAQIVVTRPDGTVFSTKEAHGEVLTDKWTTLSVRHSVSVPGPGYRVHVWTYYDVGTALGIYTRLLYRGGTALTHLMVDRINLDATESTVDESVPTTGDPSGNDG